MGNDIQISVRVSNDTGSGLAAVNTSLRRLKDSAKDAGQALTTLATKSSAAAAALLVLQAAADRAEHSLRGLHSRTNLAAGSLGELRSRLDGANTGLRSLNTRAQTADGRLETLATRTRTLRTDLDDLHTSATRTGSSLGGLRGSLGSVSTSAGRGSQALNDLKKVAISLAPALIPIAAQAGPIAAGFGAGAVALTAFTAALIPQLGALKDASDAQKKAGDAVSKYGAASKQAAEAQDAAAESLNTLPGPTKRAAAAFLVLKDSYKQWSNGLAGDTMPVLTKSFATFGALLPKLNPLVRDTSTQLDRLVTAAAGGVNSSGFDALVKRFEGFSQRTLKEATDDLIHFSRVLSEGRANGPIAAFMDYARANGPQVRQTLSSISEAVTHLLEAAAEAGPGLLTLVNTLAKLVSAVPTSLLANLLQVYTAFKLIKLAGLGIGAVTTSVTALGTRLTALRAASVAAGGGLAGLRAAFLSLGTVARATVVVAGIAALALILTRLSNIGKEAPPNVDRLTTSLGKLAQSGKVSGEAARVFGSDFGKLGDALRTLSRPSNLDKTQQFLTQLIGMDSTPVADAKTAFQGLDEALSNLVKGGKADLAASALEMAIAKLKKQGFTADEVKSQLDGYKSALADVAFEQELAAQSMGVFGQQALDVQAKLDAQKRSADGLRQSIVALNETNRSAFDAQTKFEAAIDNVTKSLKDNGRTLDVGTEKGRANRDALSQLASATDDLATKKRDEGASWSSVNAVYERGRAKIIEAARAMGYSRGEAKKLADQILSTPNKTALLKADINDLKTKLAEARDRLARAPLSKRAAIWGDIADLQRKLEAAQRKINGLRGRIVNVGIHTVYSYAGHAGPGGVPKFADGGEVTGGSGTRDDVPILAMGGEFMVKKKQARKYLPLLEAINEDRVPKYASGGLVKSDAGKQARSEAAGLLTISYFGQRAGYKNSEIANSLGSPDSLGDLVSSLNKWRSLIKGATAGATESRLLKALNSAASGLIKNEKALTKVNSELDKAKDKLSSLKDAAAQLNSQVSSGILASGNITGMASGGGLVTLGGIKSGLAGNVDEAKEFAAALNTLKSRGLNGQSISEIAQAGLSGGGLATARTLLGASSADIKEINALESQLKSAASSAGKTTADAFYGASLKAADVVVKGLQKQQDRLEAAMAKATASLERTLERALGVKGKAAGGIIGAASGGPRAGWTLVGEQGPELARLPYGSTVYPAGATRQMLGGGGGGGGQVIQVNLVLDGKVVARQLIDPMAYVIRSINGGDVQGVLGQGKVRI